jgi:hypothetical protein
MVQAPPTANQPQIQQIEELAIAISAKKFNPTILSEEFLKFSGIVPQEWALARQPVVSANMAQITFQNGLNINAQPRLTTFVELIGGKEFDNVLAPAVARQYVEKLAGAEYQQFNLGIKTLVPFSSDRNGARKFITETLLSPGPWSQISTEPLQATVTLQYKLTDCQLVIAVNEATLQVGEENTIAALLFGGTFIYSIASESPQERINLFNKSLNNWQRDIENFREIVKNRFLRQEESLFPSL